MFFNCLGTILISHFLNCVPLMKARLDRATLTPWDVEEEVRWVFSPFHLKVIGQLLCDSFCMPIDKHAIRSITLAPQCHEYKKINEIHRKNSFSFPEINEEKLALSRTVWTREN